MQGLFRVGPRGKRSAAGFHSPGRRRAIQGETFRWHVDPPAGMTSLPGCRQKPLRILTKGPAPGQVLDKPPWEGLLSPCDQMRMAAFVCRQRISWEPYVIPVLAQPQLRGGHPPRLNQNLAVVASEGFERRKRWGGGSTFPPAAIRNAGGGVMADPPCGGGGKHGAWWPLGSW